MVTVVPLTVAEYPTVWQGLVTLGLALEHALMASLIWVASVEFDEELPVAAFMISRPSTVIPPTMVEAETDTSIVAMRGAGIRG